MKIFKLASTALTILAVSACSSIVSKSDYNVAITSTPSEALFSITNKAGNEVQKGTTPQTVSLKASSGYFQPEAYTITVKKEDLQDTKYNLTSTIDGWYIGNVLIGGLIGWLIVDPLTGAMYKLPDTVNISLSSATPEVTLQSKGLNITSINDLSLQERALLQPLN